MPSVALTLESPPLGTTQGSVFAKAKAATASAAAQEDTAFGQQSAFAPAALASLGGGGGEGGLVTPMGSLGGQTSAKNSTKINARTSMDSQGIRIIDVLNPIRYFQVCRGVDAPVTVNIAISSLKASEAHPPSLPSGRPFGGLWAHLLLLRWPRTRCQRRPNQVSVKFVDILRRCVLPTHYPQSTHSLHTDRSS